jgi:ABC-type sugar transport system ATPase subunit
VCKRFGAVRAVDDVSLGVRRNSIHALVGENGAGKSTLVKIVAGVHAPDSGTVLVDGDEVSLGSPREAIRSGIAAVPQEASLVPRFTVYENVFLGAESGRWGFLSKRRIRKRYEELSKSAGLELAPDQICAALRPGDQQKVEILRALCRNADLLVLDEPTAALGAQQRKQLHTIVRSLAASGKTVILVSHVLSEVLELADTVTVMRDGRIIRTSSTDSETEQSLIQAMLGRSLAATFPTRSAPPSGAPVLLSVTGLSGNAFADVSLEVRAGEIVGLAGLVGAGRTELARAAFAADRMSAGSVVIGGKARQGKSPRSSMASGLAMLPESRKDDGLIFTRSVIDNVSLASLPHFHRLGFINRRAQRAAAEEALRRCTVVGRPTAGVGTLSGGNQQKALFARMLMSAPKVLIADEPTRGVDVGARRAIYDLLMDFAADGGGVLLISSEVEEILGLAHRVLVMRRGKLVRELEGDEITESAILTAAFDEAQATATG